MSEFVNTRDVIGDQATVDGLVEQSLTELKEDGISKLPENAFFRNQGLSSVEFPNVIDVGQTAFQDCSNLESVKLGSGQDIYFNLRAYTFYFSNVTSKLKRVVFNYLKPVYATKNTLDNAFGGTPIRRGDGAIYVPNNLVDTYRSDSVWDDYKIISLDRYPDLDTIGDSWATIFANSSYATAYSVKDSKTLELTDGTKIIMDLAAIDTDVKSDDSGTAKMTWICHGIPYTHRMNESKDTNGGWADSEMRSWLISDILSKIPTEIKSHIVSVKKSYRSKSPNDETLWSDDEIWIPSYKEVGFVNASCIESDGVVYSGLFNSNRIKYNTSGSAYSWWLRSANGTGTFRYVGSYGNESDYYANNVYGVVFGFCTD